MNNSFKFQFSILLIFFLVNPRFSRLTNSVDPSIPFFASINNELKTIINMHCVVDDLDIGFAPVLIGKHFSWTQYVNPEKKKKVISVCDVISGSLFGEFKFFDFDRDSKRCDNRRCIWYVKTDGVYLDIKGKQVLQFHWSF